MTSIHNSISSTTLKEVIHSLSDKLRAYYIFPEIAEQICERIKRYNAEGQYRDITEGDFLAYALTTHMQEVNQDKHLWVRWHAEPLPNHDGSLLKNKVRIEELKQKAKLENYGMHRVERLPGNIGLIDIRYFYRPSWGSGETITAAMNLLANMSAIIIDLRSCLGGNPSSVVLVSSYFFGEEPVHLNTLYWRENDQTEQYWTLPYIPGSRIIEQPVYILTSEKTFSAGEEFSYNLQALERATIIGEATGGGAHPGSSYRLHPHFEAFIPNGRAINPITKDNWEGVGVQPDIPVPTDKAFETAYRHSLRSVMDQIKQPKTKPMMMLMEETRTALQQMDG